MRLYPIYRGWFLLKQTLYPTGNLGGPYDNKNR